MSRRIIFILALLFLFLPGLVSASSTYDQTTKDSFHNYNGFAWRNGININAFSVAGFNSSFVLNRIQFYGYFYNPDNINTSNCYMRLHLQFLKNSTFWWNGSLYYDSSPEYVTRLIQNQTSPDYFTFDTDAQGNPMSLPADFLNDNYQVRLWQSYNAGDLCNFNYSPEAAIVLYDTNHSTSLNVKPYMGFYNPAGYFTDYTPYVLFNGTTHYTGKTPVLIVPGVLGTDIKKGDDKLWLDLGHNFTDAGDQFMDPLQFKVDLTPLDTSLSTGEVIREATMTPSTLVNFNYAKELIDLFTSQGYAEGDGSSATLFTFPYDWRYGVSESTVNQLQQKIQEIMAQTGSDKVDIVAHSTGGLIVKKYVMDHPTDHHISKAVFVGVPNLGSPKALKVLMMGDSFGIPWLANSEMQKIGLNMPAVYDLSPSALYNNPPNAPARTTLELIHHTIFSDTKTDLNFGDTQAYLTANYSANQQAFTNANALHENSGFDSFNIPNAGVDFYNLVGCKAWTVGTIQETNSDHIMYYGQGVSGDGTVPQASAESLAAGNGRVFYLPGQDHGKLLSANNVRQEIVNLISGSSLPVNSNAVLSKQDVNSHPEKCKMRGRLLQLLSPAFLEITDASGATSTMLNNADVQNDIPGVTYETYGDHKLVFLPDDEGQIYTIKLKGTGTGVFTLKDQEINDDVPGVTEVFNNIPVTSGLTGQLDTAGDILTLDTDGNGTTDATLTPDSVLDASQSLDLTPPVSTSTIAGLSGQPGGFVSSVSISLLAEDPVVAGQTAETSGVLKTLYKLDGDAAYTQYQNPIVVNAQGPHSLKFYSIDKAGNSEPEQTVNFEIFVFSNLFSPLSLDSKTFKKNSTIPVKFQLTDSANHFFSAAQAKLYVFKGTDMANAAEAISTSGANVGNSFRYDATNQQYIFNLSTSMGIFTANVAYGLRVAIDGDPHGPYDQFNAIKIK